MHDPLQTDYFLKARLQGLQLLGSTPPLPIYTLLEIEIVELALDDVLPSI
jgi:hypothetical protein